jgi:hypothetical protein
VEKAIVLHKVWNFSQQVFKTIAKVVTYMRVTSVVSYKTTKMSSVVRKECLISNYLQYQDFHTSVALNYIRLG